MSSDLAIRADGLGKCYQVYDRPSDRLKQFILPRYQRLIGSQQRNYYRDFWAVRDISFEVKRGESVGILGRNGSGKSTLLQMICGTLTPSAGQVKVNGRVAALLELGSGFNPEFSGRENVYLNGALLGLSKDQIDKKFDSIAAFADIGQFIDQPVKTYSSGMLVRLAFAVQVQVEPDILIVDEALAVGDALFQKRCFQRIEKLLSDGTTLLFVSHDIESVRTLTHKALLLSGGTAITWGGSSDVVREYRKLLHEEEAIYFSELTKQLIGKSKKDLAPDVLAGKVNVDEHMLELEPKLRSDVLSFGQGGAEILSVEIYDDNYEKRKVFYPGEKIKIKVVCLAKVDIERLNVAIRIRNKEGVKIYSWGTLNQDMGAIFKKTDEGLFWMNKLESGNQFEVEFEASCNLGQNLYEVQAQISFEETPDYLNQVMLHWRDEAAFFQVMVDREEHFFGGVVDLNMSANWDLKGG